jgi:Domain of unknown function (DUF4417)
MSRLSKKIETHFEFKRNDRLWHTPEFGTEAMGCQACPFRDTCGGLRVQEAVFDCTTLCRCKHPETCDRVCTGNPSALARRMREVKGVRFESIPHAEKLASPVPPPYVPMMYHANTKLVGRFPSQWVALRLFDLIDRSRHSLHPWNHEHIIERYRLNGGTQIVLSGTHSDAHLEHWWGLNDRRAAARSLKTAGVALVTAPNFSVFCDEPRLDNLYNLKRILIATEELMSAGVQCALHVNARTERDYERIAKHVQRHTEIEYVAFELGTGAGHQSRTSFHIAQLCQLAVAAGRPLRLVLRGGIDYLPMLSSHFEGVHFIDPDPFMRTQKRRQAVLGTDTKRIKWLAAHTPQDAPLDDLLLHNLTARSAQITLRFNAVMKPVVIDTLRSPENLALVSVQAVQRQSAKEIDLQSLTLDFQPETATSHSTLLAR